MFAMDGRSIRRCVRISSNRTWNIRHELSEHEGMLFRGEQIERKPHSTGQVMYGNPRDG